MSIFEGLITDLSYKGQGVTRDPTGLSIFVHGALPGDVGKFRIVTRKKRYGFAVLEELVKPSEHRVTPLCRHHGFSNGLCGGCPWMMIDYSEQLARKDQIVRSQLLRSKLLHQDLILPSIISSPQSTGYRNRAKFRSDGKAIGFQSSASNALAPIDDCVVLTTDLRAKLRKLREMLPNSKWAPQAGRPLVTIEVDELTRVEDVMPNLPIRFHQGNSQQNDKLKCWLRDRLPGGGAKRSALELFAGSGNLTKVLLSGSFQDVFAFDSDKKAISDLGKNFSPKVQVGVANLFSSIKAVEGMPGALNAEVLLLDPPRSGFSQLASLVNKMPQLERIFYISCDLASFCRDVAKLSDEWVLKEVQPIDMFPHTPHIELAANIERKMTY